MQRDDLIEYAVVSYHWPEDHVILFIENELDKWGNKLDKPRAASGRLDKNFRPGLREVERLIEADKAGAVFIRDVSRLFRDEDMINPPQFAKTCKQHHVVIITYDQEFDFNATSREDLKDFLEEAQDAADFLKFQRRTLHRARERKGMRGEYVGSAIPTGFMLDDHRRGYVPNPVWCDVVAQLTRRYRELEADIAALHNEIRGVPIFPELPEDIAERVGRIQLRPVPKGYTVAGRESLIAMLINPANIGHKVYKQRIVKWDAHLPIVDRGDYEYALAHLGRVDLEGNVIEKVHRTSRFTHGQKREGLLAGVRSDGKPVVTSPQGNVYVYQGARPGETNYTAYRIKDTRSLAANEYCGSITLDVVDQAVSQRLEEILKTLMFHAEVEAAFGGTPESGARAILTHVATLRQQVAGSLGKLDESIADIEQKILHNQREYDVAKDVMSDHDIREHFASLARLRSRLADLQEKREQSAQVDRDIENVTTGLTRARDEWGTWTLEQRRSFLRLITQSITLDALSGRWMRLTIEWSPVLAGEAYHDTVVFLRSIGANPNWQVEEDALLHDLYPRAPRSDILVALPRRSWTSCKARARVLHITRTSKEVGSFRLMETLAVEDIGVMETYGITPVQIEAGQTAFWSMEATVNREGRYRPAWWQFLLVSREDK